MAQAVNSGWRSEIINMAVSDVAWTVIPPLMSRPNNLCIRLRETGDLFVSRDSGGTSYFTIKDGNALTYDWNPGRLDDFLWLKGSVPGTAEIIVTYE